MRLSFHKISIFFVILLLVGVSFVATADAGNLSTAETDDYRLTISKISDIIELTAPSASQDEDAIEPVFLYVLPIGSTISITAKADGVLQRILYCNEDNQVVKTNSVDGNGQAVQETEPMTAGATAQYTVMPEDVDWAFMGIEITIGEETTYFFFIADDQEPIPVSETTTSMVELIVAAAPTSSKVFIDGTPQEFQAYEINDYNYFKLRDIAQIFTGSAKQFDVTWDGEKNAISLTTKHPYTTQGGELALEDNPEQQMGMAIHSTIYLDGEEIQLVAYEINNYNYFKLRDLGKTLNFAVSWDAANGNIGVDTNAGYEEFL